MSTKRRAHAGFTLIELMIVVAILGVLAAIAVPSFIRYVHRAKAAESRDTIKHIFNLAASYFSREEMGSGMTATHQMWCTVGSTDNGVSPTANRQQGDYSSASWVGLGFSTKPSYYRYEIQNAVAAGGQCHTPAGTDAVYYFRARGDLDLDAQLSLIELAVGTTTDNELYHGASFYLVNEEE